MKLDQQKIKKIRYTVLDTIIWQTILQNFCKIVLNPEKFERLEYALAITFLKENR